jgi:hypothetical protein
VKLYRSTYQRTVEEALVAENQIRGTLAEVFEDSSSFWKLILRIPEQNWSGRRGSNSQLSAWEAEFSILYFQHLQNRLEKMYVHALHTVHAMPDLRVVAGRLRDGLSLQTRLLVASTLDFPRR